MAVSTLLYCSSDDVEDRLSTTGVDLRTDDAPPTALGNVLKRAATKVNQYLLLHYTAPSLQASDWVNQTATSLATFYLCERRGNAPPASVAADYDEAMDDLKLIRKGVFAVPEIARRRQSAPVLSNISIRMRPQPHPRVSATRSVNTGGAPEGYTQRIDLTEVGLLDWQI